MSHAAQPHLSEADTVSGLSCVDLCATSKSWLDCFMATFRRLASPRPQVQLIARYTPRLAGDLRPATPMTTAPRLETRGASVTAPGSSSDSMITPSSFVPDDRTNNQPVLGLGRQPGISLTLMLTVPLLLFSALVWGWLNRRERERRAASVNKRR